MATFGDDAYCQKADVVGLGSEFTIPAAWTDAEVDVAIVDASQQIDAVCGDHFGSTAVVLIVDGSGDEYLDLSLVTGWTALSISEVMFRESYDPNENTFDTAGTVIDTTSFAITDGKHALLKFQADSTLRVLVTTEPRWVKGVKNYRITGTFGRSFLPKAITRACALLVRERITPGSTADLTELKSERFPDGYQYTRVDRGDPFGSSALTDKSLTGYPAVDNLLAPFVEDNPTFVVI